jgi:GT2 family glycosyltransferase
VRQTVCPSSLPPLSRHDQQATLRLSADPFIEEFLMQILAVVVLYKQLPEQSDTIQSLTQVFERNPGLKSSVRVFLWDNSPVPATDVSLPFPVDLGHAAGNLGTSGAYNEAMKFADSVGCPWLLLLDQDTTVSDDLLRGMIAYSEKLKDAQEVAAVVPFVSSHGTLVSPRRLRSFNRVQQIPPTFSGLCKDKAYAVNSATLMRVAALREVGGYSDEFWLDLSDVYVFQGLHRKGKYMYIAGDLHVEHSIASMNFDKEMSSERYRNFLAAESAYVDLFLSPLERAFQLVRLFVRTLVQYRRYQNKIFSRIAWEYFLQRLFLTKASRLQRWRQQLRKRDIPAIADGQTIA